MKPINHETRTLMLTTGKQIDVDVYLYVHPDSHSDPMNQDFENTEQRDEFRRKLESGYYENLQLEVRAVFSGTIHGADYLGGCIVHNTADIMEIYEAHGMADAAIKELLTELESLQRKLS